MLVILGFGSRIVQALLPMLPAGELPWDGRREGLPYDAERYLFCAGYMEGKRARDTDATGSAEAWAVNFANIAATAEQLVERNPRARICVMGSDSGITGSFDPLYAGAKAALHLFVETKRLPFPEQQLVCVAPSIISDAGMTERRRDRDRLAHRADAHPKQRFVTSEEVARLIYFLLYTDLGYLSGVTIRMNGGEHAQR